MVGEPVVGQKEKKKSSQIPYKIYENPDENSYLAIFCCVCASDSSWSRRAAASLGGGQKQVIFIMWLIDAMIGSEN